MLTLATVSYVLNRSVVENSDSYYGLGHHLSRPYCKCIELTDNNRNLNLWILRYDIWIVNQSVNIAKLCMF